MQPTFNKMYTCAGGLLHMENTHNLLLELRVECGEVAGGALGPVILQHMPALHGPMIVM